VRRAGVDYHVHIDAHYYSVPYRFARAEVEAPLIAGGVEICHRGLILHWKRIEEGAFRWPPISDGVMRCRPRNSPRSSMGWAGGRPGHSKRPERRSV
jgi:hypothetical protein